MNKDEIITFLNETDEGKSIVDELKTPLLNKRDELFTQLKSYKDELETFKQTQNATKEELEAKTRMEEEARLKQSNDFEAYKQFHDDEIAEYRNKLSTFQERVAATEAQRVITNAANKHSNTPKPLELLLRDRVASEYDADGNVNIIVKDEKGEPLYHEGQPASVDHLINNLRANDDYAPFFAATGVSGSGTKTSPKQAGSSWKDVNSDSYNLTKVMGNKI